MTKPKKAPAPIVVTKFERLIKRDVAGNRAGLRPCRGFFRRNGEFFFEIFFDDEAGEYTYNDTRISEMYINSGGCIQWSWGGPPLDKEPDWDYGKHLLADLLAGLEPAIESRISDNAEYCIARIDSAVYQLLKARVAPGLVISALTESLLKAACQDPEHAATHLKKISYEVAARSKRGS